MANMLNRFIEAQELNYVKALEEITDGEKLTHWIWYIFPQLKGIGHSYNSEYYGIDSIDEAKEYLANDVLSTRLHEITEKLLTHSNKDINVIMGSHIDALKLKSCMTLFDIVEPDSIFAQVLDTFFEGKRCNRTMSILGIKKQGSNEVNASLESGKRISPSKIFTLKENEIFVFGSNIQGSHAGGAARVAYDKFGAIWGKGVGLQGQTYAIPTMHGGTDVIKPYVDEFIEFAKNNKQLKFLVTRIGCGIAGFDDEDMAPLFKEALEIDNIFLPLPFLKVLENKESTEKNIKQEATENDIKQESKKTQNKEKKKSIFDKIISIFHR